MDVCNDGNDKHFIIDKMHSNIRIQWLHGYICKTQYETIRIACLMFVPLISGKVHVIELFNAIVWSHFFITDEQSNLRLISTT